MRDFTDHELKLLSQGKCPACGEKHESYTPGPRGGMSQNIMMPCGARMNVTSPEYGWPPEFLVGQMLDHGGGKHEHE